MSVVHVKNDEAVSFISVRTDSKKDAIAEALDSATDAAGEWSSGEVIHTEAAGDETIYVVRVSYETNDSPYEEVRFD